MTTSFASALLPTAEAARELLARLYGIGEPEPEQPLTFPTAAESILAAMQADGDLSRRPVLADALEDDGYASEWHLGKLRDCTASLELAERAVKDHLKDKAKAAAIERVRAEYAADGLLTREDRPGWPSYRLAAENIRRTLKKQFPGTKFRVTCDSYSMGNSVDVRWTDGPTTKQVKAYTDRHQQGDFNGMEDIYEYRDNPFGDVFGEAKYVMEQRERSDAGLRAAFARENPNGLSVQGGETITADNCVERLRSGTSSHLEDVWIVRPWAETDLTGITHPEPAKLDTRGYTFGVYQLVNRRGVPVRKATEVTAPDGKRYRFLEKMTQQQAVRLILDGKAKPAAE